MSGDRTTTFPFDLISQKFNELEGYDNASNFDLGNALESWKLLEEERRQDDEVVANYLGWSFTASFLQLINAWQWFFSGVLLGRQAYLPAQTMQMYYYSIFFSYGSFLSAQFKGHYTLEKKVEDAKTKKTRREVWLGGNNGKICIETKEKGRGGEHEIRANWFYAVFKDWDTQSSYPEVSSFDSDAGFHSRFRNKYTYSLSDIAEELYTVPEWQPAPSNEILISLWNREIEWADYYPEEFWALQNIRVAADLHAKLLMEYEKSSPYKQHQILLVKNLCAHHTNTELIEVIREVMPTILQSIGSETT